MKFLTLLILGTLPFIAPTNLQAQQAKGDIELGFQGNHFKAKVGEFSGKLTILQGTFGVFVTDGLELGISPSITKYDAEGFEGNTTRLSLFSTYSWLSPGSKVVPYIGVTAFKESGDSSGDGESTDTGSKGFGPKLGIKYFFTPKAAFNISVEALSLKDDNSDETIKMQILSVGMVFLF